MPEHIRRKIAAFRNTQRRDQMRRRPLTRFAAADLSDDDRRQLLSRALEKAEGEYSYCWIRDVYEEFLTYEDWDDDATYKRTYTINDDLSVTLGEPEEVIARTVYEPVKMAAFALPVSSVGNDKFNVYPDSLLFEIRGDKETFPDKGITLTSEDLADIVAGFNGATMGLEHIDTVLGDNCGLVTDARLVSGRKIMGTVAIPKGLDELIPPGPRKVSVEIEQDQSGVWSMPRVDLVLNPRIRNAALMGDLRRAAAAFAGARHSTTDAADIQAIHDLAARQGATCASETDMSRGSGANSRQRPPRTSGKEKTNMSLKDRLLALFREAGIEDEEEPKPAGDGLTDAERKELEGYRKQFGDQLAARRTAVKALAVTAFGAGSTDLATAEADIDAARDIAELERIERGYKILAEKFRAGGNGGSKKPGQRTTEGTTFSDETLEPFDDAAAAKAAAKRLAGKD